MARGRREHDGDVLAALVCGVQRAVWGGEALDPREMNPFRGPAELSEAMKEHLAAETARRIRMKGT